MSKRRADGPARTKAEQPRKRGLLGRIVKWLALLTVLGLIVGALAFVILYKTTDIPDENAEYLTQTTKVYYSGGKQELGQFAIQDRESISYDEMPQCMKDGVVAAENRSFWTDKGIDPRGILRAAFSNAKGNATQGASTITQQYVKILYLTQERTLKRKVSEAVLSLKVQQQKSKQEILQGYLNTIYFGRGAYGVQAAAKAFFDVDAKKLNLRQCAVLSSVINNPSRFDPDGGPDAREALKGRYDYVLGGMLDMDNISQAEFDRAEQRLPKFAKATSDSRYGGQRGHVLALVRSQLHDLGFDDSMIDGGGLRITTTLTSQAMSDVQKGVLEVKPDMPRRKSKQLHVGAASVEVGTGRLLGFYGGQDYLESQINWAEAGGMAGSTFKAFTVAAAIKDGFSLTSTFDGNSPIDINGTEFENQGDEDYGSAISMLTATENSVNTAFIDMVYSMDDGPNKVIDMAERMGVPGNEPGNFGIPDKSIDLQDNLGVTLGSGQVSPINMANAYATIANKGETAEVHVIEKVTDADGKTLYEFKAPTKRAVDEDIAADTSYALQQVTQSGSGTEAATINRPVAGKTGTATNGKGDVSSSWFVGYTPQVATAVMYVRGTGREQLDGDWVPASSDGRAGYFGGNYPAKTWAAIMGPLMEGMPVEDFPEPAWVDGEEPSSGHEPYVPPADPTTSSAPPTSKAPSSSAPTKEPSSRNTQPAPTSQAPTTSAPPAPSTSAPPQPSNTITVIPTDPGPPTGSPTPGGGQSVAPRRLPSPSPEPGW